MDKMKNERAIVSIDLMFALVLVMTTVMAAILFMTTFSHEERDWRAKQYMAATRATDNLVLSEGESGWEMNWSLGNYSNVTKIGFLYVDVDGNVMNKVLSEEKIMALMGSGYSNNGTWWEFPNSTTTVAERENATRALGLEGYNFYMQLHPAESVFNFTPLKTNLNNYVTGLKINKAIAVDRYVYINDPTGNYLEYNNEALHYRLNMWVW